MPPKRKLANSGGPTSKRRANNEATPLEEANTAAMGQDPPQPLSSRSQAPIDYDLLAAAIIKQSQQPQSGTVTIAEPLQSPSNTTDHLPISHATTTGGAQSVNSSGIGALLDQVFLGESVGSNQPSFDFKDGIPLGASVSQKLKSKIWNNEYFDFKSLLDNKEEPLSVTITSGVINFHQGQKSKYPLTLNQWTDAFLIFSAIYLEKFPHEGANLLKYCFMVREMQYLHGDNAFRLYDEQFRKLKESVNIPWQNPVQELRLRAATLKVQNKPNQSQPFRARICYQFNKGERCNRNPCPFKHCCLQCKSNHPKVKCPDVSKSQFPKSSNPSQFNKTS